MKKLLFIILFILAAIRSESQHIIIENKTRIEGIECMASILIHDIFKFDTIHVIIVYMPISNNYEGCVNRDDSHKYIVRIKPNLSRKQLFLSMAHEFVHICQSEREGLYIYGDIWEWGGEWGSMTYTPYKERGWEIDAYQRQYKIRNQLLEIYNKDYC